jgi:hypothetical protein
MNNLIFKAVSIERNPKILHVNFSGFFWVVIDNMKIYGHFISQGAFLTFKKASIISRKRPQP